MDALREQYLDRLGIVRWERRAVNVEAESHEAVTEEATPVDAPEAVPQVSAKQAADVDSTAMHVQECTACELHSVRNQADHAEWMVIGDAPEAEAGRTDEPFAGEVGKLLDSMLFAAGYKREEVFIANFLKCRLPGDRDPRSVEASACGEFLRRKIEGIKPKLILCMGRIAAQSLLATDAPIEDLRGRVHRHEPAGTSIIVTLHPAELLRAPSEKRKAWQDLKLAMRVCEGGKE